MVTIEWGDLIEKSHDELTQLANEYEQGRLDRRETNVYWPSVINMLRHEYTDYDEQLRYVNKASHHEADELHVYVLKAIARDFPFLEDSCAQAILGHSKRRRPDHVLAHQESARSAQAKLQRSLQAIKSISIGDRVAVSWHGEREATVIKRARYMVTVQFEARGAVRERAYQAVDVVKIS